MGIEQHAEAAAKDIGETPTSTLGTIEHIIAKHMQAAVAEATAEQAAMIASQSARIARLESLGPMITDLIQAVSWREYAELFVSKAFPDADAALTELVNDMRAILKGDD